MNFKFIRFNRASDYKGVRFLEKHLTFFTVHKIYSLIQYYTVTKKKSNFLSMIHKDYGTRFVLICGFLLRIRTIHRTESEGKGPSIFFSTASNHSQTLRHLFAVMHLGCLTLTFNHILSITTILFITTLLLGEIYTPLGIGI